MGAGAPGRLSGRGRGRGAVLDAFRDEDEPKKSLLPMLKLDETISATKRSGQLGQTEEAQVDPLDAFMEDISARAAEPCGGDAAFAKKAMAAWEDMPADDPVASYCEQCEKKAPKEDDVSDDDDVDDEEKLDRRKKAIEPLPRVNHDEVTYEDVQFEFYKEHPEIEFLSDEEVASLRKEARVTATGSNCPRPAVSFAHLRLPKELMEGIRRHGYTKPTPIQAQASPAALSGRDVVGVAETGSGKTVAYLMPMLVHCKAQPPLQKDEGPIGLVLAPTRELAVQIEKEVYKFNKLVGLRSITVAGGLSKYQQFKEIKKGSEIVIATPGRMIDIVKMKGCNMRRCTFVVLDEADRMLQMGFEDQIRSILQNVRPKRQTLLFSATMPPRIERLASDLLTQPVRVIVGTAGQAAANVCQIVEVLDSENAKVPWLSKRLDAMLAKGQLVIFTKSKQAAEELQRKLADIQRETSILHGDLEQDDRMRVMESFRKQKVVVLIATDVAARGLDIPTIRTVVSFDVARDIETHTHRVGRTGRAGAVGEAFTLLVGRGADNSGEPGGKKGGGKNELSHARKMAAFLVEHLEEVGSSVSERLLSLAMEHHPFKAARAAGLRFTGSAGAAAKGKGGGRGRGKGNASRERSRSRSRSPPVQK
eukprot:TRINITY_DN89373_c0_g1_i1.p1 TRINITY_DN89373_c0_g1~~TRINITY_DN89373_c0_g1_i1.p1  ORF type:complete len:660 (-),score=147.38 TRINITY_DN89373_c0_g1_i1:469-2412(-)